MRTYFSFKREITTGELLTFISIVASAITVVISWSLDRKIKLQENANNIRIEISKTMNKVNRVTQLQLLYYDLLEEDFEDVAYMIIIEKKKNAVARDYLWKKMYIRRTAIMQRIMDEEWEIGYVNLLPYNIRVDSLYNETGRKLVNLENRVFHMMLEDLEEKIIYFKIEYEGQTAALSKLLREVKDFHNKNYRESVQTAIGPLNTTLMSLFHASDHELLSAGELMEVKQ